MIAWMSRRSFAGKRSRFCCVTQVADAMTTRPDARSRAITDQVADAVCATSRKAVRNREVRKRLIEPRLYTKKLQRPGGSRGVSRLKTRRVPRSSACTFAGRGYRDAMDRGTVL